jgi:hypothetical protein
MTGISGLESQVKNKQITTVESKSEIRQQNSNIDKVSNILDKQIISTNFCSTSCPIEGISHEQTATKLYESTIIQHENECIVIIKPKEILNDKKGDSIHEKDEKSLRILFQNINSLRPQNTEKWKEPIDRFTH